MTGISSPHEESRADEEMSIVTAIAEAIIFLNMFFIVVYPFVTCDVSA